MAVIRNCIHVEYILYQLGSLSHDSEDYIPSLHSENWIDMSTKFDPSHSEMF